MRIREEEGQTTVLVALAMGIFLLGAVGLAVDGSNLFWQRTMAQTAADAAAQSAMMSIFDNTNTFPTTAFPCDASHSSATPCVYASDNGFSYTKGDTVSISYPAAGTVSGVTFSSDTVNLIQVTVTRSVHTTLMKLLGSSATTVEAIAEAAIVTVESPTPLLITDPTNPDTLTGNGNPTITICGGPSQSVQVNSSNTKAYEGGVGLDLSKAGPADPGDCSVGTGASFGVFGGAAANPGAVSLGSTGKYVSPESPIQDPFAGVTPPTDPGGNAPATVSVAKGIDGCTNNGGCTLYSPGHYTSLSPGKDTVLFKPGVYYVVGGGVTFKQTVGGATSNSAMCVGCPSDANTGTGMLIYDTGTADKIFPAFVDTGGFDFDTNTNIWFTGPTLTTTNSKGQTVPGPPYYGITLWEDRSAMAQSHTLGKGNGCFTVTGTVYITNTIATMKADSTHVQSVTYSGNPCSATTQLGDIVVGALSLSGNKAAITMNLLPYGFLNVRQVALIY